MTTTNINLLPWREERRERNKIQFFIGLGSSAVLALCLVIAAFFILDNRIDGQTQRNRLIENEIARYDRQIVKIKQLRLLRDSLIARMSVIQKLQESRPEIVHFFDELVKIVPRSIYLLSIERYDINIMLTGHTDTNSSVSLLMHNIRKSFWVNKPKLEEVEEITNKKYSKLYNQFRLKVVLQPQNKLKEGAFDE